MFKEERCWKKTIQYLKLGFIVYDVSSGFIKFVNKFAKEELLFRDQQPNSDLEDIFEKMKITNHDKEKEEKLSE